jgi:hypothetical protein
VCAQQWIYPTAALQHAQGTALAAARGAELDEVTAELNLASEPAQPAWLLENQAAALQAEAHDLCEEAQRLIETTLPATVEALAALQDTEVPATPHVFLNVPVEFSLDVPLVSSLMISL